MSSCGRELQLALTRNCDIKLHTDKIINNRTKRFSTSPNTFSSNFSSWICDLKVTVWCRETSEKRGNTLQLVTGLIAILDNQLSPFVLFNENRLRYKKEFNVVLLFPNIRPVYFEILAHFKKYHDYIIWDMIREKQIFSYPARFSCGKYCGGCRVRRTHDCRGNYSITTTFMARWIETNLENVIKLLFDLDSIFDARHFKSPATLLF